MHREFIDNIVSATETDFILTTSLEGNIKFWKKQYVCVEFVKQFKAHQGKITGISVSKSGLYLCTCSFKDELIKVFDVLNFDMINFIRPNFIPNLCEFINRYNDPNLLIAVTEKGTGNIHIIKADSKGEIFKTIKIHNSNINCLKFNEKFNTVISIDSSSIIEYWDVDTYGIFIINLDLPSKKIVKFGFKAETDLYELVNNKTVCLSLTISENGEYFATYSKDKTFRIFNFKTGKLYREYNESLKYYVENYNEIFKNELTRFDKTIFDKKLYTERDVEKDIDVIPNINVQFDETGHYIFYPTILGIKVIEIHTNRLIKILGKNESERFLTINLFQGKALRVNYL
jgi:peptidylprolyl isomerase domain and WD repeat-containing protein 1